MLDLDLVIDGWLVECILPWVDNYSCNLWVQTFWHEFDIDVQISPLKQIKHFLGVVAILNKLFVLYGASIHDIQ